MLAVIKESTIVLSEDPLTEPYTIRLGVSRPSAVMLCTPDGREGYCIQDTEYAEIPEAARVLLEEGVSARKGRRDLALRVYR